MNHTIIERNGKFVTRDGKSFATAAEADAHSSAMRAKIKERFGYEPTDSQWNMQRIASATDSRTFAEKAADEHWRPTRRESLSPIERQIAELEAVAQRKAESKGDPYKGQSREQMMANDLRRKMERETTQQLADERKAKHLEAVSTKREVLGQIIAEENWNPQSDEKFRQLLAKAKTALEEPDADPAEVARLFAGVDEVLTERQATEQVTLLEERAHLEAALQRNMQQQRLTDPEPAPEREPDPYGYDNPALPTEPKRFPIDRTAPLRFQIMDLQLAMFGLDENAEVHAAAEALKNGDEGPANAVLEKYSE